MVVVVEQGESLLCSDKMDQEQRAEPKYCGMCSGGLEVLTSLHINTVPQV